ncbi:MAG: DUF1343 domain-containing protein [Proteobacteria bacterium]|jgi:uncharacterized protein YbbC (DUF1343 family)|nr:DUF1343 domain-containing protein [Pseudomonadota bacterium]
MKLGIEVFLLDKKKIQSLKGQRVGLVCHPASVDENLTHTLDLLIQAKVNVTCAFGPQHGVKGDKQYNMIESEDEIDPQYQIPIFSLYGKVRRPTPEMMKHFDVLIFDLQDVGCRIYTFATTLLYVMEECARLGKKVIVMDRPNPAGRPVEGFALESGWESFVGAAPIPMRHGLTLGELALYYKDKFNLDLDLQVIKMKGYKINDKKDHGWPKSRPWLNPSPNAATVNMVRSYPGTVLLEGTHLSEGRGTTRPLELIGAPDINFGEILKEAQKRAPKWFKGAPLRELFFEPTFYKHQGKLCYGVMFHTDAAGYSHKDFKPFRLVALFLKIILEKNPRYELFRNFAYEYVFDKLAFDVINGGPRLRDWIVDAKATPSDLDRALVKDESAWQKQRKKYFLYV